MANETTGAYSERASEYIAALGSISDMDKLDISLISGWASEISGLILDAGSGPGHWTDFLRSHGSDILGIEIVEEFVRSARERFPSSRFERGDLAGLAIKDDSLDGLLAWYSLIHMRPEQCDQVFRGFARMLKPGGTVLIGVFLGEQEVAFDHAITRAFYWSVQGLTDALEAVGFQIKETHTRSVAGKRPHLAVIARRR